MKVPRLPLLALVLALVPWASSGAQRPDPADGRRPEVWAVVVGIDHYDDPEVPGCAGAVGDARALAEAIRGFAGPSHVALLHDNGASAPGLGGIGPQTILAPTRANLERASVEWLGRVARPGDLVVFFFAGQAATVQGEPWLLPSDARHDDLARTGWTPESAIDELAGRRGCQVVCWLDTSTRGRGRAVPAGDEEIGPEATERLLGRLTRWPGASAWVAADGRPSGEGPPSPFVSALTRALGTETEPLLACLAALRRDPALRDQGFRARGGLPPWLSLRPSDRLRRRFEPVLLLQRGHAQRVNAAVLTADAALMATASDDSTVRIWQTSGVEPVLLDVLDDYNIGVNALALGEDGRYLVAGDGAGLVRGRDLAEGTPLVLQDLSPHRSAVLELVAGPDGSTFLSRDIDGRGVLWRVEGGQLREVPWLTVGARRLASAARGGAWGFAVALDAEGGPVLLRAVGASPKIEQVAGTGEPATSLALSAEGRLAVGDGRGRLVVRDLTAEGRPAVLERTLEGEPIRALRLGPDGLLAVGTESGVRLARVGRDGELPRLDGLDGPSSSLAFSVDGRWLAACNDQGDLALWDLADPSRPTAVALEEAEGGSSAAGASCVAFPADGRRLVVGDADGGVRSFALPGGRARARIAASRGQVTRIAVRPEPADAAAGRPARAAAGTLLQIDSDGQARLWDLTDGRGPRRLPGLWADGAFLPPDGARLAMIRHADDGGGLVLLDAATGREVAGLAFDPPAGGDVPSASDLQRLAVSPDGAWIAASSSPGRTERVFLWPAEGGAARVLTGHAGAINDLGFAGDGTRTTLLSACDDGAVRLWVVSGPGASLAEPSATWRLPADGGRSPAVTAARLDPSGAPRLAAAYWGPESPPRAVLWSWTWGRDGRPAEPGAQALAGVNGRVHALSFSGEGHWVVAGGEDRRLRAWRLGVAPQPVTLALPENRAHHAEQIHAVIAWPSPGGPAMVASAGDDTTVRLWRLDGAEGGPLVGTLVAAVAGPRGGEEWVAFTPSGDFDASGAGDRLVRFVVDREVRPLEQFAGAFYRYGLTDLLRKGERPEPRALPEAPLLGIDPPAEAETLERLARLRITLPSPERIDLEALRIYQDGVPVKVGTGDLEVAPDGRTVFAEVPLHHGPNRFYAMAGQRGEPGVDARSGDVEIAFLGYEEPGRTHVVALGVSDYERNALQFAHRDAESLASYLHEHARSRAGAEAGAVEPGQPGELHVLTDGQVTRKAVEDAFGAVRDATRGRPQDTVVVFLAGHTDLLPGPAGRRFSLLLPSFPFPEGEPLLVSMRGVGVAGLADGPEIPEDAYLPFREIYRELPHLDALQRLIIVDACQAEAVLEDPGVRQIREALATDSREARNSYLLAARFGEPAGEDPVLGHGLLTYVLLWGLGDEQIPPPRGADEDWRAEAPDADLDGNRVITTEELRAFVDQHLPALNADLPELAQRAGLPIPGGRGRERLHNQAVEAPFPILTLPGDAPPAGGRIDDGG